MKVYLDVDDDTRLSNRVVKTFPINNPNDLKVMLDHYVKVLKPSFEAFVSPVSHTLINSSNTILII